MNPLRSLLGSVETGHGMDPLRDWAIGLSIATIGFLTGVTFIAFDFYSQMNQAPEKEVVVEAKPLTYRERDVVKFAEFYTEKGKTFNLLREKKAYVSPEVKTEPVIPDPEGEALEPLAEQAEEQYTDPAPEQVQ